MNSPTGKTRWLADAHCHLDSLDEPDEAVWEARAAGVGRILAVSETREGMERVLALKERHPDTVLAGLGLHPAHFSSLSREDVEDALFFIEKNIHKADALGEIGRDYRHAVTTEEREYQEWILSKHLELGGRFGKPVNLHSRRAQREVLNDAVRYKKETGNHALLHWFTASRKLIKVCAAEGIFISVGPSLIFSEETAKVAKEIPLSLLLLETDSPVPCCGIPAQPAWVERVAERSAEVFGVSREEIAGITWENFSRYLGRDFS